MSIEARDPRQRYWVQTTKKELEGKLGSTFSLSNGLLGIRGAHEECPSWGRPEFYVAGTYAAGPASLLGVHDPDHILTHPQRMTPEALASLGDQAIQVLPNLPFPIALQIEVAGGRFDFDSHRILSAERMLEIDEARLRRTLVFRDAAGRRTRVDSQRFVSMAEPNLICLRATIRRLNHEAPITLRGKLHEAVTNTNGIQLWTAGERVATNGQIGLECITRGTGLRIAIAQTARVVDNAHELSIELYAIAGQMPLAEACKRATIRRLNHEAPITLRGTLHEAVTNTNGVQLWTAGERVAANGQLGLECITRGSGLRIAIAQTARVVDSADELSIELYAIAGQMPLAEACKRAKAASQRGFDACSTDHVAAYQLQTRAARVEFDANASTVQGFNFGQMHLHMAFSPIAEKTGLPIKGLTGHGYRFLTFWDMDFHMFPYYLMTRPRQARKLLEYRFSQLPQYRENARRWGAKGAQVPWETNTRGVEETAPWLCLQEREIHISADAAYMFMRYAEITGDRDVMRKMGAEFVFETARFYASRLRWNAEESRYELPDIGCPDQYHTFADNNVFISLMAKWNLGYAAECFAQPDFADAAQRIGLAAAEAATWRTMAEKLFIHEPGADDIIEQCDGFFALDADLGGICETYCSHSQAVKQPDVLAAFIPFESRYPRGIRRKNWHYYNARTLHGSSLSLPGMAYAAARCGLNDEALYNLHASCRMDLDDVNLDTERGVHVSGGAVEWGTIVHGFGGLDATGEGLTLAPNLPRQWSRLAFSVHWHFQRVDIEITRDAITVTVGDDLPCPVPVRIASGDWQQIPPGTTIQLT